ncbi:protein phosphatase 2C domain-containing protein [Acinetobacter baumannii]|uniref:PP2C family protein-serine/threonine phosphatase n=1 Tax=Acinetobacter baumannii TaxID=470 RepID=UPI00244C89D0|nr:protein phosphatase 2C domain-containing protein [Acinetobacter baumannii]MDH2631444.1 protein phosphatase 2C domain-containing protein [Acinetobacter baumannii]
MNPLYFSSKGPRITNEDSYLVHRDEKGGLILIIADGLGGHKSGKFASHYAASKFVDKLKKVSEFSSELFINLLTEIHSELLVLGDNDETKRGMATTFSCIYVTSDNRLWGVHIGDSRVYLLRENGLQQLTEDHTEAQRLFNDGLLTKEELINYPRKNILSAALGARKNPIDIQTFSYDLENNDRILLATDGFYNNLTKRQIRDLSVQFSEFSEFFFEILFLCKQTELKDNCSIIGVEILKSDS